MSQLHIARAVLAQPFAFLLEILEDGDSEEEEDGTKNSAEREDGGEAGVEHGLDVGPGDYLDREGEAGQTEDGGQQNPAQHLHLPATNYPSVFIWKLGCSQCCSGLRSLVSQILCYFIISCAATLWTDLFVCLSVWVYMFVCLFVCLDMLRTNSQIKLK